MDFRQPQAAQQWEAQNKIPKELGSSCRSSSKSSKGGGKRSTTAQVKLQIECVSMCAAKRGPFASLMS
eukprot:scaffold7985_cov17-Tisochrysis_lutea.AAC.1